jgi:hypothetical protein
VTLTTFWRKIDDFGKMVNRLGTERPPGMTGGLCCISAFALALRF